MVPAGVYLIEHQVRPTEFNSYGARRGNHDVMMRGTFANIRIKNMMLRRQGGRPDHPPSFRREQMSIYDAAMRYKAEGVPLVVFARQGIRHRLEPRLGGQGHAPARHPRRDRPVVRAHSPIQPGLAWACCRSCSRKASRGKALGLTGNEKISIAGVANLKPRQKTADEP